MTIPPRIQDLQEQRRRRTESKVRYRASEKGKTTERAYCLKNKEKHGVTRDEADRMIEAQGGACAACGSPPRGTKSPVHRLHVDHNAETGKTRGMLCHHCNLALGLLEHSSRRLRALISYLERHD